MNTEERIRIEDKIFVSDWGAVTVARRLVTLRANPRNPWHPRVPETSEWDGQPIRRWSKAKGRMAETAKRFTTPDGV